MAAEQQEAEEQVAVEQKVHDERMAGRRMSQLLQGVVQLVRSMGSKFYIK